VSSPSNLQRSRALVGGGRRSCKSCVLEVALMVVKLGRFFCAMIEQLVPLEKRAIYMIGALRSDRWDVFQ
jgi:hypothetical protein